MFKLDNFDVILFVSFSYKKLLRCLFYENLKNRCKNRLKNSKKFVYYIEKLVTNSKFQTKLSRKLQRFRTCRKNKKCSILHELYEYQQKTGRFFPIARIPEAWKRFPDSVNRSVCIEAMTNFCYNTSIFLWFRIKEA